MLPPQFIPPLLPPGPVAAAAAGALTVWAHPALAFRQAAPGPEASGVQPIKGPDGKQRWYAFIGAAAWTSIAGRMGMFVYIAENRTGPYVPGKKGQ